MQVFIFGASGTKSFLSEGEDDQFVIKKLASGNRLLDWIIQTIKQAGLADEQITFIGGSQIEKVINLYPQINYVVNPRWSETHVVGSLMYALNSWQGEDVLLLYADTLYRSDVLKKFLTNPSAARIGIDKKWRERVNDSELLSNAEKVVLKDESLVGLGRNSVSVEEADAQFTGLTFLHKDVVQQIYRELSSSGTHEAKIDEQSSMIHLLHFLKEEHGISLEPYDVAGQWAELDSPADLARFVFGTKAETLDRIRPLVKQARICDQKHFTLKEWHSSPEEILDNVQNAFEGQKLIIRSSSLEEDSWESSQAGAFLSVSDIEANDRNTLQNGIEEVIEGFYNNGSGHYNEHNQVLIQPFISDVNMSGVVFSKHLENGTPYYLINYDDVSKRTDTVTSGNTLDAKTVTVYKEGQSMPEDSRLQDLIKACRELEEITGYSSLDIEFVLTNDGSLYIVQVRPITLHGGLTDITGFSSSIEEAKSKVSSRLRSYPHIFGDTTILSDMPDWNPAEMIGVSPSPLALSLYQYLITDSAWRVSRADMGYNDPSPEKLLFCIGGHPYVDVRNSFNNLIPAGISPDLGNKLINHYIKRLKKYPHLHDKVEFEIVLTCLSPDFESHARRLYDDGFSEEEVEELKKGLHKITNGAITGKRNSIKNLLAKTDKLDERRKQCVNKDLHKEEIPSTVNLLLDDCINLGTIPFSVLARYGFIASSMLKGFVALEIISEDEKDRFLNSIETVAGDMVEKMNGVLRGSYPRGHFLEEFGHLRPGSYEITSYRYDEKPEQYFPENAQPLKNVGQEGKEEPIVFSDKQKEAMQEEIRKMGLQISTSELLTFIKEATAAREYAKFQFTKNLSDALRLIAQWGESYGFSRKDLSFLFIEDFLRLNKMSIGTSPGDFIDRKIKEGEGWYEASNMVETPQMIFSPKDLEVIVHNTARPNFVTSEVVRGSLCNLSDNLDKESLAGSIVLAEGADPGYDWIFMHPIKGLITKYGGAASHMTIRCAEFGLPAAIGAGEEWYNRLIKAQSVELNCANKQIRILQ